MTEPETARYTPGGLRYPTEAELSGGPDEGNWLRPTRDETPHPCGCKHAGPCRESECGHAAYRDETPRDPLRPLPWADNAAAALDELDRLYYDGAGPTVAEWRAATDAVRAAIHALASSTQDAPCDLGPRYGAQGEMWCRTHDQPVNHLASSLDERAERYRIIDEVLAFAVNIVDGIDPGPWQRTRRVLGEVRSELQHPETRARIFDSLAARDRQ